MLVAALVALSITSHFECMPQGARSFRPFWMQAQTDGTFKDWSQTAHGLLGQNAMGSQAECDLARENANAAAGVICSRTGLNGWKPTIYTGTAPGRADFGYLGGSSIIEFNDCLQATKYSSSKGVCFWGGSDWYVSPIDRAGLTAGPFSSVAECITHTMADE